MFELNYKIVHGRHDDFWGQNGFLQIKCNGIEYGDLYPKELEAVMDKVSLYDWVERFIRVIKNLSVRDYVVLSDVDSYNTWIEFRREKDKVVISIVKEEKEQGSRDIEFCLKRPRAGEWTNQVVDYIQMKSEVTEKAMEYLECVISNNAETVEIKKLKDNLISLLEG